MEYKLMGTNDYDNPLQTFLGNRGVNNTEMYTHLDDTCLCSPCDLDNIERAVQVYKSHIENNSNITIIADCDVDGYSSAAMVYMYTKNLNPECKLTYLLHIGKQHGLTEDIEIPENTQLLIIPDAGRLSA